MASLTNCQPVDTYTAEEFPGDSIMTQNLELQSLPAGTLQVSESAVGLYFLVIKPLPGYRIHRGMISIGNETPDATGDFFVPNPDLHPNGVNAYWSGFSDTNLSAYVSFINIYDSAGAGWEGCDNNVIVEIGLLPQFEMPNNDVTVLLDLGGTAVNCEPTLPDPTPTDGTTIAGIVGKLRVDNKFICSNNSFWGQLFIAANFNDWDAANAFSNSSSLQMVGTLTSQNVDITTTILTDSQGDYSCDPCGCLPDEWYNIDDCIGSLQPTCFTRARNTPDSTGFNDVSTPTNNVFPSVEAMFLNMSPYYFPPFFMADTAVPDQNNASLDLQFPNGNGGLCNGGTHIRFIWDNTVAEPSNTNDYNFLFSSYPTIEPNATSGSPLPTSEQFIIKVGNGQTILPETVDVWGALTIVHKQDGEVYDTTPGQIEFAGGITSDTVIDVSTALYYQYTEVNNQCHFDLSSVTKTQGEDNSTVIITVPYRTDLSLQRQIYAPQFNLVNNGVHDHYENRVFFNVYAVT
jgi:hypothetical protein